MKTLLLDQTTWGLCLDTDGNIAVASDPYSVAQDVASALRLFAGELWYNTAKGVPYFGQILGRAPAVQVIKAQFVRAAMSVPGVTSASVILASVRARILTGQVLVTYSAGAVAAVNFTATPQGVVTVVGGS